MRTSQIRWIRENLRQGGVVWILAEVSPYVYVIEGKYANDINGRSHSYLRKIAHKVLKRGQNEDAAQILHEILLGEKTRFT